MTRSSVSAIPYQFKLVKDVAAAPLDVFEKLYGADRYGFLYESLETSGSRGRYSFLGGRPLQVMRSQGAHYVIETDGRQQHCIGNPFDWLRAQVQNAPAVPRLKPFPGGAVGYAGYDAVRWFEKIPDRAPAFLRVPDLYFIFPGEIVVFDHADQSCRIILYHQDRLRLTLLQSALEPKSRPRVAQPNIQAGPLSSNCGYAKFIGMVNKAKAYIYAGDIFQVVLSQRFSCRVTSPAFTVYQACRRANPSPYMYYLNLSGLQVIGSSPELLVKLTDGEVMIRPLAGTRPRGRNHDEDRALARELLRDHKERAEHVMLVDLARNDIGRVCSYGSVRPDFLLKVEKYSRVMHLVSDIRGRLAPGRDAFDLFRASFPAGTVTGAPKIRAMEIIDELEPQRRAIYAGAIGYFGYDGNMDMCIAIRTIVMKNRRCYIQAGAGIVADSNPRREYLETLNKANALFRAVNRQADV